MPPVNLVISRNNVNTHYNATTDSIVDAGGSEFNLITPQQVSELAALSGSTPAGRAVLTSPNTTAIRATLGLGTAAVAAATDFATAAQGAKADTALQAVSASVITDASVPGKSLLTAPDVASQRTMLGISASSDRIDPSAEGADTSGAASSAAAYANTQALANNTPRRGYAEVEPSAGVYKIAARLVPADYSEGNDGSTDSVRVALDPTTVGAASETAFMELNHQTQSGTITNGVSSQGYYRNIVYYGDRSSIPPDAIVHGIRGTNPAQKQRAPILEHVQLRSFSGFGLNFEAHDQLRMTSGKITDCEGAIRISNCQDTKVFGVGFGGITGDRGVTVEAASSTPMWTSVDIWPAGSGQFKGKHLLYTQGSHGARFIGFDVAGPTLHVGSNNNTSLSNGGRQRWMSALELAWTSKINTEVAAGYAANHAGDAEYQRADGTHAPKAQDVVQDFTGLDISFRQYNYGQISLASDGAVLPEQLNARPDYLVGWRSANNESNADIQTDRRGIVKAYHIEFSQFTPLPLSKSGVVPLRTPEPVFKKRPFSDDRFADTDIWDVKLLPRSTFELAPGDLVGKRYIALAGQTGLSKAMYPLAYLWNQPLRTLDDAATTFDLPDIQVPSMTALGLYYVIRHS